MWFFKGVRKVLKYTLKNIIRALVTEDFTQQSVYPLFHKRNLFVGNVLKWFALWKETAHDWILFFISPSLIWWIRMSIVYFCWFGQVFAQIGKFTAVIARDGFKYAYSVCFFVLIFLLIFSRRTGVFDIWQPFVDIIVWRFCACHTIKASASFRFSTNRIRRQLMFENLFFGISNEFKAFHQL